MKLLARRRLLLNLVAIGLALATPALAQIGPAFLRSEEREACADHQPLRRPMFGDLHVHTSFSFDSYTSAQKNEPRAAYAYAAGEPIWIPGIDGEPTVESQLRRPLDFVSVTDHAEFLGEINLCTQDPWTLAYWTPLCLMTRSSFFYVQLIAASQWVGLGVLDESDQKQRSWICNLPGKKCADGETEAWTELQAAAEEAYDRTSACRLTTFVGYEYTDAPNFKNLHRNVIFRNERVTERPINTYDTGTKNFPELWRRLREECIEGEEGCDVLAIPHNPNLSGGLMFPDPVNEQEASDRIFFEPVTELIQHKAASECRFDRLAGRGVGTSDELCTFEQNKTDNLSSLGVLFGEIQTEEGAPVSIDDFGRRNMMRNVLKDGLVLGEERGVNPFQMGFIGSTDTHSAIPGGTMEDAYPGHLGRRDTGYRNVQDHFQDNPGGLAVVWSEENSRDAIFEGIRRKETYATSGTRPRVRFFAGPELLEDLCEHPERIDRAYAGGVPMGGAIDVRPGDPVPRFLVLAQKDPGTEGHPGTDLERIQIIKGWVDATGATHERVHDVAGGPTGASVDPETCAPLGSGHRELCRVWQDPDYDPAEPAFYYLRVLENPTCRWSTLQCQAAGVNPFAPDCQQKADAATAAFQEEQGAQGDVWSNCCLDESEEPFYSPTLQERAWTSPIWLRPREGDPRRGNAS